MRRAFVATLFVLIGLAIVIGSSFLRRAHEKIPWRTDYEAAVRESRATGKPMLLDFTAEWCGPCQDMRRTTWSDPAVAQSLAAYIPVQINLDTHADLATQFGVSAIPHLTVVGSDGSVVTAEEGELSPEDFRSWLAAVQPASKAVPAATSRE